MTVPSDEDHRREAEAYINRLHEDRRREVEAYINRLLCERCGHSRIRPSAGQLAPCTCMRYYDQIRQRPALYSRPRAA